MIEIVERARLVASSSQHMGELMREMADEIERLRERETDAKQLAADNFERVKRGEVYTQSIKAEIERLQERNAEHEDRYEALDSWHNDLKAEIKRLRAEMSLALREATRLLESFVREHCSPVPEWKPLSDLVGVLSQLSNAVTIARDYKAEIERLKDRNEELGELARRTVTASQESFTAKAEIERLGAALKECADDLEAWINHHYEKTMDYPSEKSRYERDMEPVLVARKLLDQK